ncbi:DUF1802 family protein [Humisphaera borealis]|uniref:DUF1802 family protein n=1 Tax=Humisphaera borealis TaxID=2807512 RepID=A0A7M2WSS4_9BACT|nr:DUF1802 family protein [Humisphaera borealis]QOV88575.1 DUF1802 family protein [Humisphaera borealis]
MLPPSLHTGLKEWKLLTDALASGRQIMLLRKGGIIETAGEFELESRHFVFFPTYIHQNMAMVKPGDQAGFESHAVEPKKVTLAIAGEVTDIVPVAHRSQVDKLENEHVWTPPLIDMRFSYKPENPLYIVLVRAYRLATPVTVVNSPAYAGCKSWVPLIEPVNTAGATPALDERDYAAKRDRILSVVGTGLR